MSRWFGKRITVTARGALTVQDLADYLEILCQADVPPTTRIRASVNGVKLDRWTLEAVTRHTR